MKIVEKMTSSIAAGETFFSFEYFPPRTEQVDLASFPELDLSQGLENLMDRMENMVTYEPTFCDITWGAGGSTADLTLEIATRMQNMVCVETMMHLTCTNMPVEKLSQALKEAKEAGIQNILALRGDPPKGQQTFKQVEGGFSCALDLIKYIRKEYGDYFGICVAGYPEAHPDSIVEHPIKMKENYWADIKYLKEKIEAGSDFVITQLFYETERFLQFVDDCRSIGIKCPIIPGIMPIMTYGGFHRMTNFCKTYVPEKIRSKLEEMKDDDAAIKEYGISLGVEMCRELISKGTPGVHVYTLNMSSSALEILKRLGVINDQRVSRRLPWKAPTTVKRSEEMVRPIFWSNRPKSYIKRTEDWAKYACSRSPAYGTFGDYPFMQKHKKSEQRLIKEREAFGKTLTGLSDVMSIFINYTKGIITLLPWNEMDRMQKETEHISASLVKLNSKGFLTINSQPQINGAPSSDAKVGWGGPNGVVYQKAYVEFFVSPEDFEVLLPKLKAKPSLTYIAVNVQGDLITNMAKDAVNAVTWGVFPCKEIIQPTIVDINSFLAWKDEAFDLWMTEWGMLYDEGSKSRKILEEIQSNWLLVSLVENNYQNGSLFEIFDA